MVEAWEDDREIVDLLRAAGVADVREVAGAGS